MQLSTVYTGVSLSNFSVFRSEPVVAIAIFSGINRSTSVASSISQGVTGTWSITPSSAVGTGGSGPSFLVLDLPQFGAWTVGGGPSPATGVPVSNQSNAFAMTGAWSAGTTRTVSFSSPQLPGLEASLVELVAGSSILAGSLVQRWVRRGPR